MAPQFVDFNADGHLDIFTATFDGSPHVAYGSANGFQEPQRILDADGERVLLTQFWNYETKEWDDTDRTIEDNADGQLHCISSVAFDWDDDGDFDLLLGDKNKGRLFRQMNEGTNAAPKFTGKNIPVLTDSKPFELSGGMTVPYLVDWDADGLTDLVCGSFGDSYGDGEGGGVFWYRNVGTEDDPKFAKPVTLIQPSAKDSATAARPDSGLYVDVVDYNGDGALDLVVGGYSHWNPPEESLSDEERQQITDLQAKQRELMGEVNRLSKLKTAIRQEVINLPAEERKEKLKEFVATEKSREQQLQAYTDAASKLSELKPGDQREAFVWLYPRTKDDALVSQ